MNDVDMEKAINFAIDEIKNNEEEKTQHNIVNYIKKYFIKNNIDYNAFTFNKDVKPYLQ